MHSTNSTWRRLVPLLLTMASLACSGAGTTGTIAFEVAPAGAFSGHTGGRSNRVFDVVAADMDADGDDDLLINWHHLGPMELFENVGDRLELVNPRRADRSGLYDNRDIASLFAATPVMLRRIEASSRPGLYVWHDLDRRGYWRLLWIPPPSSRGAVLDVETSLGFEAIEAPDDTSVLERSERALRLTLPPATEQRIRLRTVQVTVALDLTLRTPSGEPLAVFVGRDLTSLPGGRAELWKPDPHGIAWVDVEGDSRPEIYVTRGGLIGRLRPPLRGKRERYYLPFTASLYELAPEEVVPRDWARSRSVEWVDVDGDGRLDASIAAEASPNRILVRPAGAVGFSDRAASLGLDLVAGAVQTWGDHDGDGHPDLYVLDDRAIDVLRQTSDGSFERLAGAALGLDLPEGFEPSETLFDFASIRLADVDADGELDVWLLSAGRARSNFLFRRSGDRYEDVTRRLGLDQVDGSLFAALCDLDGDRFEDVLSADWRAGESRESLEPGAGYALLWHNRGGSRFAFERLSTSLVPRPLHAGTCLDFDADGRQDVAAVGTERNLLLNRTLPEARFAAIVPRYDGGEAVGALARAHYSDGRIVARRYGSARNSAFSQSLAPLHFGVPDGLEIVRLTVQWPGEATPSEYPPPALGSSTVVRR